MYQPRLIENAFYFFGLRGKRFSAQNTICTFWWLYVNTVGVQDYKMLGKCRSP